MPVELSIEPDAVAAPVAGFRGAVACLRAHLPFKLTLLVGLSLLFCVPYFLLGNFPARSPRPLPMTPPDEAIGFDPRWVYLYQSLYLLIPLSPFFSRSRDTLRQYARAFALLSAIGFAIFLVYPTRCPRPADPHTNRIYSLLVAYDPPTNAFPSMHIALAVQSLLLGMTLVRTQWAAFAVIGAVWLLAIAYATLATKQHYAVDLVAGAALAVLCHVWVFHRGRA